MKKLLLLGAGAQGSTVAKRMNEEPNVSEIICADYDEKAIKEMERTLEKATALKLDATRVENIVQAADGVDLLVNALPILLAPNALQAALEAGVNYQDFAAAEFEDLSFEKGIEFLLTEWNDKFAAKGLSALMSTGSAPGLANVITRETTEMLDTCNTIQIHVYEGVWAKRFLPFWWSPEVALGDMSCPAYCYEDGQIKETEPFSGAMRRNGRGGGRESRTGEHAPVMLDVLVSGAASIHGARGHAGMGCFPQVIRLLEHNRINASPMITSRRPFSEFAAALGQSFARTDGKIMVHYP